MTHTSQFSLSLDMAFLLALVLEPIVAIEVAVYLPAGIRRNLLQNLGELLLMLCDPSPLLVVMFGIYAIVTGDFTLFFGSDFLMLPEGAGHLDLQT